MRPRKRLVALLLAASTSFALAACSDDGGHGDHMASSSIPEDEDFNQADVDFATDMIQHHAQALSMADLADERDLTPAMADLVEQIRMAQGPEIESMVGWLADWDQPVPETMRDHANAHGDGGSGMDADMPGMMSADEMERLEAAQDEDFEPLWLEMMIEHHEGAIEMADDEKSDGEHPDAIDLAKNIIEAQKAEIEEMEQLLAR